MQIDRFNHLQIPSQNMPSASENESSSVSSRVGLTKPQSQLIAPASEDAAVLSNSVVLKIQFPNGGATQADHSEVAVYTDSRKSLATAGTTTDSASLAANHQRAMDRNAGIFTQITLSKDGVMVAKPQPTGEAKPPDFVALAVSAMREFSDEAERNRAQSFDFSATPVELPWGKLKGLHQLAAKFNVFA
jgi:hypothetical protein